MTFLAHRIQARQQQWKKCVDGKEDYAEKLPSFNNIP